MKVLLVQKVDGIAGSEKYLSVILPKLVKKGVEASFLLLTPGKINSKTRIFADTLEASAVPVYYQKINSIPSLKQLKSISHIIKANGFEIVHSNLLYADAILVAVKILFINKMVLVSGKHGYDEKYTAQFGFDSSRRKINKYWLIAWIAEKFINRSFIITKGLYDLFIGLKICSPAKTEIIKYGFDFDDDFKYDSSLRFGSPQLVVVGRLLLFKGHKYAIQAVSLLAEQYPDIKLIIVGWGEEELRLKRIVEDLGLQNQVIFVGYQSRARDFMFTSDVVLLPSVSEGLGIVLLEAMSVKRPVVAFNVPSPSEIFQHNKDGLLATPFDVKQYAELIKKLIENPELRQQIAINALIKLKDNFNAERMLKETINFYQKVR